MPKVLADKRVHKHFGNRLDRELVSRVSFLMCFTMNINNADPEGFWVGEGEGRDIAGEPAFGMTTSVPVGSFDKLVNAVALWKSPRGYLLVNMRDIELHHSPTFNGVGGVDHGSHRDHRHSLCTM
ncbi:hypothetical protein GCM10009693_25150 [Leucobacter chromiireducens subsp. chromiireducens]